MRNTSEGTAGSRGRLANDLRGLFEPHPADKALLTIEIPENEAEKRLVLSDAGVLLRASSGLKAVGLQSRRTSA